MLCYELGEKGVKEESRTSEMMQELRLMTGVVAAEVQKLWMGFGWSMNRCMKQLLEAWGQSFFQEKSWHWFVSLGSVGVGRLGAWPDGVDDQC